MKIDKLGRIVVAGMAEDHSGKSRLAVWRFTDIGRLDPDFGDRGFAKTELHAWGWAVDLASDGTIVAAGFEGGNWQTAKHVVFVRFSHQGSILETRKLESPLGGEHAVGLSILAKRDGTIVIGGAGSDTQGVVHPVLWTLEGGKALPIPKGTKEARVNALLETDDGVIAAGHLDWKKLAVWKDGGEPTVTDAGMGRSISSTRNGFTVGGFRYLRKDDDSVREEQAVISRFPEGSVTIFPKEEGVLNQESFAMARTGSVLRLAGYVGVKDGVRAALWGVSGEEVRLRLLPGSTGREDRAYALTAYETGNRRLAIWSVP